MTYTQLFSYSSIVSQLILVVSLVGRQWSQTHGFFMIMGGFHIFKRGSNNMTNNDESIAPEDDDPLYPLDASDFICTNIYSFTMPTEAKIQDREKSDWLAKSPCSTPNIIVHDAVHRTGHRTPSSHTSRDCDTRLCSHEFCDLHFLVEQTSQCQSVGSRMGWDRIQRQ